MLGRLPKPTRHPINFFFLCRTHKYCSMVIGFFSFAVLLYGSEVLRTLKIFGNGIEAIPTIA